MRVKSGADDGSNCGIGNSFDAIAASILHNNELNGLLIEHNFKGSIVIHVEPCHNQIRHIEFCYGYKVR